MINSEQHLNVIRQRLSQLLLEADGSQQRVELPVPFSRASLDDFARIVELWNDWISDDILTSLPGRSCPACGSDKSTFLFKSYDQYPFHSCSDCRAWYVPYEVNLDLIEKFFADCPKAGEYARKMAQSRFDTAQEADQQRFNSYFDLIGSILGEKSKLAYFDIGCGVGHSLGAAARRSWEAGGVDHNAFAVDLARKAGLNAMLPGEAPTGETYDLISLFETLEHVTDPTAILSSLRDKLSLEGLLILTIPTKKCWELALFKQKSLHIFGGSEEVGHINLLDTESLERLLTRSGFSLLHTEGQFSNNYNTILHHLFNSYRPEETGRGFETKSEIELPSELVELINALDILCHPLDQLNCRSPILVAIACRDDAPAKTIDQLKTFSVQRKQDIRNQIIQNLPEPEPESIVAPGKPIPMSMSSFVSKRAVITHKNGLNYRSGEQDRHSYIWESSAVNLSAGDKISCRGRLYGGELLIGLQQDRSWIDSTIVLHQAAGIFELVAIAPKKGKFNIVLSRMSSAPEHQCHVAMDALEIHPMKKDS